MTAFVASLFACNAVNLFLYGALTVQLYLYYTSDFQQDSRRLKTIVYLIYATETANTLLLIVDLGFFVLGTSAYLNWSITSVVIPVCGGIVAFLTQATYAVRVRLVCKLKYVSWCIMAFIVADFVIIIVLAPLMTLSYFRSYEPTSSYAGYGLACQVWASISLAIDTTIAGILTWSLMTAETISKPFKSRLIRLVYLIIGTGTLTAAINLLTVILFALRSPAIYGPPIILSKLYANSMMVFLNNRILGAHDCGGQAIPLAIDLEGSNHARGSALGRLAVDK